MLYLLITLAVLLIAAIVLMARRRKPAKQCHSEPGCHCHEHETWFPKTPGEHFGMYEEAPGKWALGLYTCVKTRQGEVVPMSPDCIRVSSNPHFVGTEDQLIAYLETMGFAIANRFSIVSKDEEGVEIPLVWVVKPS